MSEIYNNPIQSTAFTGGTTEQGQVRNQHEYINTQVNSTATAATTTAAAATTTATTTTTTTTATTTNNNNKWELYNFNVYSQYYDVKIRKDVMGVECSKHEDRRNLY